MKEHQAFLNKTFIITTPDALSKPFLFEDDRRFLISMLEDRSATIGSHDRKNLTKLQLKQQKRHKVEERKKVELSKARAQFEVTSSENISCLSSTSDGGNSQDEIPGCSATAHRRTVKTGAILEIPYDILSKSSVAEVMTISVEYLHQLALLFCKVFYWNLSIQEMSSQNDSCYQNSLHHTPRVIDVKENRITVCQKSSKRVGHHR